MQVFRERVPAAEQKAGGRSRGYGTPLAFATALLCCCLTLTCHAVPLALIQLSSYKRPLPAGCAGSYLCSSEMPQSAAGFSPMRMTVEEAGAPAGEATLPLWGCGGSPSQREER